MTQSSQLQLSIIVPCHNEQDILVDTTTRLLVKLDALQRSGLINDTSHLLYVDDGSNDGTWPLIEQLSSKDPRVRGIKLSRNRGHQIALLAGLLSAEADVLISLDADLQDDPSVIDAMIRKHLDGAEVVYGVRSSRKTDTVFKRWSAMAYYRLVKGMGVDLVENHADFRLLSRRVVESLRQYGETNLFLRGIIPLIGFPSAVVHYDRQPRLAGISKYPLGRMVGLAAEGITSFSVMPLRAIAIFGFIVSSLSFVMILHILFGTLVLEAVIPGWASSVLPIYFFGGVQLLAVGIVGEYVAKIYLETKARPRFFIEKQTTSRHNSTDQ